MNKLLKVLPFILFLPFYDQDASIYRSICDALVKGQFIFIVENHAAMFMVKERI